MTSRWTNKRWSANYHSTLQVAQIKARNIYIKKITIKLSLKRTRTKTLNYAHEVMNKNPEILSFALAAPNRNLKLRLKNSINWKSV